MATTEEDLREEGPLARLHRLDVAAYEAMTAHHSPRLDRALAAAARRDGFEDSAHLLEFFDREHGRPFEGYDIGFELAPEAVQGLK